MPRRPSGRARGVLPRTMIEQGWPFAAEFEIPKPKGLGTAGSERLRLFLRDRDHQRGSAGSLDIVREHFRQEADAEAFVAEFAELGARRVTLPARGRSRR